MNTKSNKPSRLRQAFKWTLGGIGVLLLAGLIILGMLSWVVMKGKPDKVDTMAARQFITYLMEDPELMSSMGFIEGGPLDFHSDELSAKGMPAIKARKQRLARYREEIDRYDRDHLPLDQQLTWDIWAWWLDAEIEAASPDWARTLGTTYVVNQLDGIQSSVISLLSRTHRLTNDKLIEHYFSRMQSIPAAVDQTIRAFEYQLSRGVSPPRVILEKVQVQIDDLLGMEAEAHPLVASLQARLAAQERLSDEVIAAHVGRAAQILGADVQPAFERLKAVVEQQIPVARVDQPGVLALPDGAAVYRAQIRKMTSVDADPGELHQLGIAEVARLESEITSVLDAIGIEGESLSERMKAARSAARYGFTDDTLGVEALTATVNQLIEDAAERSAPYFSRMPAQRVELRPIPAHARNTASNSYSLPAANGSRPGYFNLHMHDPSTFNRMGLPTLTFHEAIPGHHFQLSRNVESDLPLLRQYLPFAAFSEGWALYAEILATEIGLHDDDPYARLGALWSEMFRAARLVVDTGLHHKGWTHQQAVEYMARTLQGDESFAGITREINRYLVQPAQALAYKVGQLKISELRQRAESALGEQFDIQAFHEVVLEAGSVPLAILEDRVEYWIEEQLNR